MGERLVLAFDTETTGLPKNYKAKVTDVDNWPRVIQLAFILYGTDRQPILEYSRLIKPDGWVMPTGGFWEEHGYAHEQNMEEGVPIRDALCAFLSAYDGVKHLVAHNLSYDHPVLGAEMVRAGLKTKYRANKICTKEASTAWCNIPGRYGRPKWPTLTELHTKLFGEGFDGAHDALADVQALGRCLFGLEKEGVIEL